MNQAYNAKTSTQKQVEWIYSWVKDLEKPLFICSENHDTAEDDLNSISLEALFDMSYQISQRVTN